MEIEIFFQMALGALFGIRVELTEQSKTLNMERWGILTASRYYKLSTYTKSTTTERNRTRIFRFKANQKGFSYERQKGSSRIFVCITQTNASLENAELQRLSVFLFSRARSLAQLYYLRMCKMKITIKVKRA